MSLFILVLVSLSWLYYVAHQEDKDAEDHPLSLK